MESGRLVGAGAVARRRGESSLAYRSEPSGRSAVSYAEELQLVADADTAPEDAEVIAAWDAAKPEFCEQEGLSAHDRAWIRGIRAMGMVEQTVLFSVPNEIVRELLDGRLPAVGDHAHVGDARPPDQLRGRGAARPPTPTWSPRSRRTSRPRALAGSPLSAAARSPRLRRSSMSATRSRRSSSVTATASRTPPPSPSPKHRDVRTTPFSSTATRGSARPISCMRSPMTS